VITLGDLNDGPFNNSVKKSARCQRKADVAPLGIYNPFEEMAKRFWNHRF
jgi:hypothetical protein